MDRPVLMRRRTFLSIGKPLIGRCNIVMRRNPPSLPEGRGAITLRNIRNKRGFL